MWSSEKPKSAIVFHPSLEQVKLIVSALRRDLFRTILKYTGYFATAPK